MSKAEELASKEWSDLGFCNNEQSNAFKLGYLKGYRQAEKDLTNKAKVSSGWDGFYYGQGYKQAEKDLELTWEDIDKIGNLFNECMSKLEKENSGYADYGVPSKVLAQEVLKAFYEQKQQ